MTAAHVHVHVHVHVGLGLVDDVVNSHARLAAIAMLVAEAVAQGAGGPLTARTKGRDPATGLDGIEVRASALAASVRDELAAALACLAAAETELRAALAGDNPRAAPSAGGEERPA